MTIRILALFLCFLCAQSAFADDPFAPISLGSQNDEVRVFILQRQYLEAAKALDAKTPETLYVKAWLYSKAKQHEAVIETLNDVQSDLLDDRIALLRAFSLLELHQPADAEKALLNSQVAENKIDMALRIRARARREMGDLANSEKLYQQLLDSEKDSEIPVALLGLARIYNAQKKPDAALAALLRLDIEFPSHWAAEAGRKWATQLVRSSSKLNRLWTHRSIAQRLERAGRLLKIHRNQSVVAELKGIKGKSLKNNTLSCEYHYTLGHAHRKLRQWKEAYPLLVLAVNRCTAAHHALAPLALYGAALAAERTDHPDQAVQFFQRLSHDYPEHYLADDGVYYEVRHQMEDAEDLEAAEKLACEMVERFPKGDMLPDTLFYVTQIALQNGDLEMAKRMLEREQTLPARAFDHRDAGRNSYWLGYVYAELGHLDEAAWYWRKTLNEYPLSWYALLAYARLDERFPLEAQDLVNEAMQAPSSLDWTVPAPLTEDALNAKPLQKALLLGRLGLVEEANDALNLALPNDLLRSAELLDHIGAYWLSHNILRRKLSEYRKIQPVNDGLYYWKLAYPRPFEPLVENASSETGIEKELIWAIMREESGFSVQAESFANALGLMQILLKTGQGMAKADELPLSRQKAMEPQLNILLGTRFLAQLFEKSKVVHALVPAGYNAGRGALERWLKARGDLSLDLFIEAIPFEETRGYTKRVNAAYATYQFLYGPQAGQLLRVPLNLRTVP